ncbi:MAG: hypothetical protein ACD_39C00095G0008 [uncultured bacterium]|nr:MAG: hypothetical protein ACD_39C00095G0008 [uncultured bacterium]
MNEKNASKSNEGLPLQILKIHIDKKLYESPSPTSGQDLYTLGNIDLDKVLYRVSKGSQELLIENDSELIYLQENEQFRSDTTRLITIIVEGTPHEWAKLVISYAEVVTLFVPDFSAHPEITYSVTYKRGHGNKPEGILSPGASVKVKKGMVFNVSATGQS